MMTLHVAKDFSDCPAGRYFTDGPFSGEALAHRVHIALATEDKVVVDLDGTRGYGASFIDGFADALRVRGWTGEKLGERFVLISADAKLLAEFLAAFGFPSSHEV